MKLIQGLLVTMVLFGCGSVLASTPQVVVASPASLRDAASKADLSIVPERLPVNLKPLVQQAMANPDRFAVPVEKSVDATTQGQWSVAGGVAQWAYSVSIPGASSMSFHAATVALPDDALVTQIVPDVQGLPHAHVFKAADWRRHELWGVISRGDTLQLRITVPVQEKPALGFRLTQLFAGFRGVGGTSDSQIYRTLKAQQAGEASVPPSAPMACDQNFACFVDSSNQGPGNSAVYIVLNGGSFCSGNLLNDTAGDFKPYVLTSSHCNSYSTAYTGAVFYWQSVTPCGETLGDGPADALAVTQGATIVAAGGTTRDFLLYLADGVADASTGATLYWAGWDATNYPASRSVPAAPYFDIQYGAGWDRQYTTFANSAKAAKYMLQGGPATYFLGWQVYSSTGRLLGGASGSALFDGANRVIGNLSGNFDNQASDACPAANTQQAEFSGVYDEFTGDDTSTGSTKPWLDTSNTGKLIVDGVGAPATLSFTSSASTVTLGQGLTLTWAATGETACTASGDWSGKLAVSGSKSVTPGVAGTATYTLACMGGGQPYTKSIDVTVKSPAPTVSITAFPVTVALGSSATLTWSSTDASSCTASGAWTGMQTTSGSLSVTPASAGIGTYTLTCSGSGGTVSASATVTAVALPTVTISATPASITLGQSSTLTWSSTGATSCTASGAWSGPEATSGTDSVTPTGAGTQSYTLSCSATGGTGSATVQVTVKSAATGGSGGGGAFGMQTLLALAAMHGWRSRRRSSVPRI